MKKLLSTLLSAAIFLSANGAVFAETKLESIVKTVKSRLDIPPELTRFSAENYTDNDGNLIYELSWVLPDDNGETNDCFVNYNVQVTSDAEITSVNSYYRTSRYDYSSRSLPDFSKDEAVAFAENYIKKAAPDTAEKMRLSSVSVNTRYEPYYTVRFDHYENDFPVVGDYIELDIYKYNDALAVTDYVANITDGEYPSPETAMSEDAFREYVKSNSPLELNYHDSDTSEKTTFLQYSLGSGDTVYFSAADGHTLNFTFSDDIRYDFASGSAESTAADKEDAIALSPEEINEIETVNNLNSPETSEAYIRGISELGITEDMRVSSSSLSKTDSGYITRLTFENDDFSKHSFIALDSKTNELISSYTYTPSSYSKNDVTDDMRAESQTAVENFLKKYFGEKFNQVIPDTRSGIANLLDFNYCRNVNGIPYYNNGISVSYDLTNNIINDLSVNWDNALNLPSADGIISSAQAVSNLAALPVQAVYVRDNDQNILAYTFGNDINLDAVSGKTTSFYQDTDNAPAFDGYSDIDNHWVKDMANSLADAGIYFDGGLLKPDEIITQEDFFKLLCQYRYGGYSAYPVTSEQAYNLIGSMGITLEGAKDPAAPVTRELAAKYLITSLGYKRIAELNGIFVCGFTDDADIDPNMIGYVAIAKGLGCINGNTDGAFLPKNGISRAEAIAIIYRLFN